jgi:predicted dehydrogenase
MKNIRFGIIGLSAIADTHIQSIQESEHGELVAVSSRSAEKRDIAAQKYGVKTYKDYQDLVKSPDVDAICICTASGYHLGPTLAAAWAGKHILCEKPLEISVKRAEKMIRTCREANIKLGCIFQNRYREDFQKLLDAVTKNQLGKLYLGNAYIKWYRDPDYYQSSSWKGTLSGDGGGALINQSIHTIDLLQLLMGPIKSVYGKTGTMRHEIEGEDMGVALLEFSSGALGMIEGSTAIKPGFPERLELFGERGSIIYEGGRIVYWNIDGSEIRETDIQLSGEGLSDPKVTDISLHKAQIIDFMEAVQQDREPAVNGEEALKSQKIIEAIYRSSKSGEKIEFENAG